MNKRMFSLLLNIFAIAAPTTALWMRYGLDARIDPNDAAYLGSLAGAIIASFLVGTISARTLHSTAEGFSAIMRSVIQAMQADTRQSGGDIQIRTKMKQTV